MLKALKIFLYGVLMSGSIQAQDVLTQVEFENFKQKSVSQKREILEKTLQDLISLRQSHGKQDAIKIAIIGAGGGGGHKSAGDSMKTVLERIPSSQKAFQVVYIEPIPFDVKSWNDAMKSTEGNKLKWMIRAKPAAETLLFTRNRRSLLQKHIKEQLEREGMGGVPDIFVQAEHLGTKVLHALIRQEYGSQHRLVPTDFQLDNFVWNLRGDKDPLEFRIDIGVNPEDAESANAKTIKNQKLDTILFTGYPVRWEILDLAERLHSEDANIKDSAMNDVRLVLKKLAGDKNYNFEQDQSVLVMIGAAGGALKTFEKHIHDLALFSEQKIGEGKVHLFIAQALSDEKSAQKLQELSSEIEKTHPKLQVHLLGKINALEVGVLMFNGVSICKSGGGSIAELATVGGSALFDNSLSKYIRWEKFAYRMFQEKGWGYVLNGKNTIEILNKAFANREQTQKSMLQHKNQFHYDWPYAVLRDLISIESR